MKAMFPHRSQGNIKHFISFYMQNLEGPFQKQNMLQTIFNLSHCLFYNILLVLFDEYNDRQMNPIYDTFSIHT